MHLQKFCLFYKDLKHDTKDCLMLKKKIGRLITKGYLKQFVKRHIHIEKDREKPNQPTQVMPKISVILKSTSARRDTFNGKRKYRKHVLTTNHHQNPWHKPIIFTLEDGKWVSYPHENVLVISWFWPIIESTGCWWIIKIQLTSFPKMWCFR